MSKIIISYDYDNDNTIIDFCDDFDNLTRTAQLDAMQDGLCLLEIKYNESLNKFNKRGINMCEDNKQLRVNEDFSKSYTHERPAPDTNPPASRAMSSFKENLKRARVLKGMNQEELANILGVKQASISQFERGDRIPTPKNLKKIAEALDVSVDELTGDKAGVVGQTQLMRKIKGLSPNSLETLGEMADFLRSKEENF